MKTGMEWPLAGLALVLLAVLGWNAWQSTQVDLAVATLSATSAGKDLPAEATLAGEWLVKALVNSVVGGSVTALVGAGIWWARRQWKQLKAQPQKWTPGPNAQWAQAQPRAPRPMSEAELYRMLLAQQITGNKGGQQVMYPPPRLEADDEPTFIL